ncbi:hypothetical protein Trydic_g4650 [Trypoxylus dichotomus]
MREDVMDDPRSGQPELVVTKINVTTVRIVIQLSMETIAEELQINREVVRLMLTEKLDMRKDFCEVCIRGFCRMS